jgi:hypothetical protein
MRRDGEGYSAPVAYVYSEPFPQLLPAPIFSILAGAHVFSSASEPQGHESPLYEGAARRRWPERGNLKRQEGVGRVAFPPKGTAKRQDAAAANNFEDGRLAG